VGRQYYTDVIYSSSLCMCGVKKFSCYKPYITNKGNSGKTATLSMFEVKGRNRKQVQDNGAKFRCEVARNDKVKKSKFYPPQKKKFGGGDRVLPKLQKKNQQQNIV